MGYVDDYKAVADYILSYEEFKKVVPEEVNLFEEKANELLVFLKMQEYDFSMDDFFEYLTDEEETSTMRSEMYSAEENLRKLVEEKTDECFGLIGKAEEKFKEKTKISVYSNYSKVNETFYFEMRRDDVVQLTPQAQALKDSGIKFEFDWWVDEY